MRVLEAVGGFLINLVSLPIMLVAGVVGLKSTGRYLKIRNM